MSNLSSTIQQASIRGAAFDAALLQDGPIRDSVMLSHPLVTDSIQIATPAVRAVYAIIDRVIRYRLPGTVFAGAPRVGKTTALMICARMLAVLHPGLPVGKVLAVDHDRSSEVRFWGDLAESLGLTMTSAREPIKARNKTINAITTHCSALSSSNYLMLSDEVQNWGVKEWSYMKDLGNLLQGKGIRLLHIGFAQEQVCDVKAQLQGRRDLIGRFLKVIHPLDGVMDLDGLQSALKQLDDPKFDYPADSGICCSEFFLPQAYPHGWRLADEAVYLWAGFNVVARRVARSSASNVSMNSVVLALKEFLEMSKEQDGPRFKGSRSEWLEAVRRSGFAEELC